MNTRETTNVNQGHITDVGYHKEHERVAHGYNKCQGRKRLYVHCFVSIKNVFLFIIYCLNGHLKRI